MAEELFNDIKHTMTAQLNQLIPGWDSYNKNQLCNLYIENEQNEVLKNAYFGAILLKYWNKIPRLYQESNYVATYDECYDWVVDAIMYALSKRKWLDKESSIYQDPNGPDKAINRKIKHIRMNALIAANRQKRQLNLGMLSLELLQEDFNDMATPAVYDTDTTFVDSLVCTYFNDKDYFNAFMIDGIINSNCFLQKDGIREFNVKRLVKHLKHIDDTYCKFFAAAYQLDFDVVQRASTYVVNLPSTKMKEKIEQNKNILRRTLKEDDLC